MEDEAVWADGEITAVDGETEVVVGAEEDLEEAEGVGTERMGGV